MFDWHFTITCLLNSRNKQKSQLEELLRELHHLRFLLFSRENLKCASNANFWFLLNFLTRRAQIFLITTTKIFFRLMSSQYDTLNDEEGGFSLRLLFFLIIFCFFSRNAREKRQMISRRWREKSSLIR